MQRDCRFPTLASSCCMRCLREAAACLLACCCCSPLALLQCCLSVSSFVARQTYILTRRKHGMACISNCQPQPATITNGILETSLLACLCLPSTPRLLTLQHRRYVLFASLPVRCLAGRRHPVQGRPEPLSSRKMRSRRQQTSKQSTIWEWGIVNCGGKARLLQQLTWLTSWTMHSHLHRETDICHACTHMHMRTCGTFLAEIVPLLEEELESRSRHFEFEMPIDRFFAHCAQQESCQNLHCGQTATDSSSTTNGWQFRQTRTPHLQQTSLTALPRLLPPLRPGLPDSSSASVPLAISSKRRATSVYDLSRPASFRSSACMVVSAQIHFPHLRTDERADANEPPTHTQLRGTAWEIRGRCGEAKARRRHTRVQRTVRRLRLLQV
ncbi:hypothetical protein GE09DRAFT_681626 [Coniochaeta sp. 2T2.1]|nr:hypothetical protein GE09DRAFT_681626 [Coniochaeta sp. 2T2.1]